MAGKSWAAASKSNASPTTRASPPVSISCERHPGHGKKLRRFIYRPNGRATTSGPCLAPSPLRPHDSRPIFCSARDSHAKQFDLPGFSLSAICPLLADSSHFSTYSSCSCSSTPGFVGSASALICFLCAISAASGIARTGGLAWRFSC